MVHDGGSVNGYGTAEAVQQIGRDGHGRQLHAEAGMLGIHPQKLRDIAQDEKTRGGLGFPVTVAGRTVLIPKVPFLRFMGYEGAVYLP